jgi:hypothetical protein
MIYGGPRSEDNPSRWHLSRRVPGRAGSGAAWKANWVGTYRHAWPREIAQSTRSRMSTGTGAVMYVNGYRRWRSLRR